MYGERPPLVIAASLYPALEAFLDRWRRELGPRHDRVFSRLNGEPLTEQGVHRIFTSVSHRLTSKRLNPHLIRDMSASRCLLFLIEEIQK